MFWVGSYLKKQMKLTFRVKSKKEEEELLHKGMMEKKTWKDRKNV